MKKILIFILSILLFSSGTVSAAEISSCPTEVFTESGSVMYTVDQHTGDILSANDAALEFYGYSSATFLSMNLSDISLDSFKEIESKITLAQSENENYILTQQVNSDNIVKDVEAFVYPFTDEAGDDVLFITVHDISARISAENTATIGTAIIIVLVLLLVLLLSVFSRNTYDARTALELTNKELTNLFINMNEGFALHEIICDSKGKPIDYRFLDVNRSFEEITGLKYENVINRRVKDILPGTEDIWIEKYGDVAINGSEMSFTNYSKVLNKHFSVSVYSPSPGRFATIFSDITNEVLETEKTIMEKELLETIIENPLSGYWDWDILNHTQYYSPSFKEMFGYAEDELENVPETWQKLVYKEDLSKALKQFDMHVKSKGSIPYYNELRYHHRNGSTVWVICSGRVTEWLDGKPLRMVGMHINISQMKQFEQRLFEERLLLETTLNSLSDGVVTTDKNGLITVLNPAASLLTEWTFEDAFEKHVNDVCQLLDTATGEQHNSVFSTVLATGKTINLHEPTVLITKSEKTIPVESSVSPVVDKNGDLTGTVFIFKDFSEKIKRQEQILYLSYHDQLTGLYNRRYFENKIATSDILDHLPLTVAMIDVNGLKMTNDAFGHAAGDQLLKKISSILSGNCREMDLLARVGGDEFYCIFPSTNITEATVITERIYQACNIATVNSLPISASVGFAVKTSVDEPFELKLLQAEEEMYDRKLAESQRQREKMVDRIMDILFEKSPREKIHSDNVAKISLRLAELLNLSEDETENLKTTALLHDIGKISVDMSLLNAPRKLNDAEFENIKKHSKTGYHILKSVDRYTQVAEYVLSHHERYDGSGYPRGTAGNEIPLTSRIISIADAYEAMSFPLPYQSPLTRSEIINELKENSGTQFDPKLSELIIGEILKGTLD